MKKTIITICIFLLILTVFWWFLYLKNIEKNPKIVPKITRILPSDAAIFTQWIYKKWNDFMISSGAPEFLPQTNSVIGILKNGDFQEYIRVDKNQFFGEGITEIHGILYWTFWKNQKIFAYNTDNFIKIWEFDTKNTEGWGLTNDGKNLILSDGSEFLSFIDPKNGKEIKKITVHQNNIPIQKINELEYINGIIWANIWLTNDIIAINPNTWNMIHRYNFDFLKKEELNSNPNAQEMNGIAFDSENNEIILTGKMWKHLYAFKISSL